MIAREWACATITMMEAMTTLSTAIEWGRGGATDACSMPTSAQNAKIAMPNRGSAAARSAGSLALAGSRTDVVYTTMMERHQPVEAQRCASAGLAWRCSATRPARSGSVAMNPSVCCVVASGTLRTITTCARAHRASAPVCSL